MKLQVLSNEKDKKFMLEIIEDMRLAIEADNVRQLCLFWETSGREMKASRCSYSTLALIGLIQTICARFTNEMSWD